MSNEFIKPEKISDVFYKCPKCGYEFIEIDNIACAYCYTFLIWE